MEHPWDGASLGWSISGMEHLWDAARSGVSHPMKPDRSGCIPQCGGHRPSLGGAGLCFSSSLGAGLSQEQFQVTKAA